MKWKEAIVAVGMWVLAACGASGNELGDCVDEGDFTATYNLQTGSDASCPLLESESLSVMNGALRNDCTAGCDCDVDELGPPTCQGRIQQVCQAQDFNTDLDCTFDSVSSDRFEGSCTVTLSGSINMTCGYDFIATRD